MRACSRDLDGAAAPPQLFEVTDLFQMRMRPELLLLQKTMVVVEGVARSLDPNINMWTAAEPVVRAWIAEQTGAGGAHARRGRGAGVLAAVIRQAPRLFEKTARIVQALSEERAAASASASAGRRAVAIPLWIATAALIVIATKLLLG